MCALSDRHTIGSQCGTSPTLYRVSTSFIGPTPDLSKALPCPVQVKFLRAALWAEGPLVRHYDLALSSLCCVLNVLPRNEHRQQWPRRVGDPAGLLLFRNRHSEYHPESIRRMGRVGTSIECSTPPPVRPLNSCLSLSEPLRSGLQSDEAPLEPRGVNP